MRQVIIDTETTGFNKNRRNENISNNHRIIEIGCVEILNDKVTNRTFHAYLNPNQPIDPKATEIHGITNDFLKDKRRFEDVVIEFLEFIKNSELIIHNAPFDIAFLDKEFSSLPKSKKPNNETFFVIDTLEIARTLFPGTKNDLDTLCKRFNISGRENKHGALIDAKLLAQVYLKMKSFIS